MRTMKSSYQLLWILPLAAFCAADGVSPSSAPDAATFSKSVQPFFAKNCIACHNAKVKMGGIDFGAYANAGDIAQDRPTLEKALRKLEAGEMPPPARPRPDAAELSVATKWIDNELNRTEPDGSARTWTRRLNRSEYNRTVRDLLGVDIQAANDFPPDDS